MNPEFENLLRLLESTDVANVRLGLQLARNYEAEVEAHFGSIRQDLEALFDFLMQYEAWNFKVAFWEVTSVSFYRRHIQPLPIGLLENLSYLEIGLGYYATLAETLQLEFFDYQRYSLPTEIWKLKNLRCLVLKENNLTTLPAEIGKLTNLHTLELQHNQLQTLPAEIGQLQNLKHLNLYDNPLQFLPEDLCNLTNTEICIQGTPEDMYIPEKVKAMWMTKTQAEALRNQQKFPYLCTL